MWVHRWKGSELALHLLDELVLLLTDDLSSVIIISVDVKVLHLEVDLVKHFHHLLGQLLSLEAPPSAAEEQDVERM